MKKLLLSTLLMLSASAYAGSDIYSTCIGCHGADAKGNGTFPNLVVQDKESLINKLTKYKNGEQVGAMSSMMYPMVANLSEQDIESVAEYIVSLK